MSFFLVHKDIVNMQVDAVVNAANTELKRGSGVCGAIFEAAGEGLQEACDTLAPIETGMAVRTAGFKLSKHIIHTAGPVYVDGTQGEAELLHACYWNSLQLAVEHGCESIAFPLISAGIYGYPPAAALQIAQQTILAFLQEQELTVYLSVWDKKAIEVDEDLSQKIAQLDLQDRVSPVDVNGIISRGLHRTPDRRSSEVANKKLGKDQTGCLKASKIAKNVPIKASKTAKNVPLKSKQKVVDMLYMENFKETITISDRSFRDKLFELIDKSGKTDPEVYKKANIDRKLFSKIRNNKDYTPRKENVLALALSLELNLLDTEELLRYAGLALSPVQRMDVIVKHMIEHKQYDIYRVNEILHQFDAPLLGGVS